MKSKGVKEKYLKKLNRATLEELSREIDTTDPIYSEYFEHVDSEGIGCRRMCAGFVHELLKKFGVQSYVIFTRDSKGQSAHTSVMVKMPICKGRFPWYVVPCTVNSHMDVKNIIEYLIAVSMCNRNRDIGEFEILHKFGGTTVKTIKSNMPLTCSIISYAGKGFMEILDNTINALKKAAKK